MPELELLKLKYSICFNASNSITLSNKKSYVQLMNFRV